MFNAPQTTFVAKNLRSMRASLLLAEKMGALLERGVLLQRTLPS
tara:strand:- start:3339 stop:3470 length:132 start_codon:yes stop_codon:yes gene_type:complete